jgi:type I restriction enzyme, R subunit
MATAQYRRRCPHLQKHCPDYVQSGQTLNGVQRSSALLEERGISFEALVAETNQPDADPFDLLCYIVFSTPLRTRRERANRLRRELNEAFKDYRAEAREILDNLLELYAVHGVAQFTIPDALYVRPISDDGDIREIAGIFGGPEKLREAVQQLQALLYAA